MKISVIIAVYNTEKYLPECLDSLLRQTHTDWEAWCVDDCSTDGSLKVLNDYAERDSRFHVFHTEENVGQAKARNIAIRQCDGDLVTFLDSDDWLSDDGLEQINRTFCEYPDTGCVLWDCRYVHPDRTEAFPMPDFEVISGKEAFEKSLSWKIHGIYATTAVLHKKYLYDETTKWYSDDNTTRMHYLASKEVRTCKGIYYYRQHSESITHVVNIHHFDMLEANNSMRSQLLDLKVDDDILKTYEEVRWRNVVDCYFYYFVNRKEFNAEEQREIKSRMRNSFLSTKFGILPTSLTRKFGYAPLFKRWNLFCLQEELYFMMREVMGRNVFR